jgi:glycosyltransferase involved in cell wall biosynthesis
VKLAIISHTEHYKTTDGTIVGWGPTVNEINHLLDVFDTIYHVAMLHDGEAPPSAIAYTSDRVKFVALKPSGGRSVLSKFRTIFNAPCVISTVSKTLKAADYFQLRTPTGVGVYLIPYLTWFSKKKGWYKYAGNWNQDHPPLGYRLQRYLLKKQSRPVTINGQWDAQPTHCISFENPCLTVQDLIDGVSISKDKTYKGPLNFCFVGRLERPKGVEVILKAFSLLTAVEKQRIGTVHFVGDGQEAEYFKLLAKEIPSISFLFHGFLSRQDVFKIYEQSHIFMLPSMASEGFPKVIAEAMNFGCIPLVSNVSSISQYIDATNGYVLDVVTNDTMAIQLKTILNLTATGFKQLLGSQKKLFHKFSFEHYNARIKALLNLP